MAPRLASVRVKLLTLVSLPVALTAIALPLLGGVLDAQMVDEVDDRASEAEKSLQSEVDDDLATLTAAGRTLASDGEVRRLVDTGDRAGAAARVNAFAGAFPGVEFAVVDAAGASLAAAGPTSSLPRGFASFGGLVRPAAGAESRGLVDGACVGGEAPPAGWAVAIGLERGAVVACLPFDDAYVQNAADKLGLQLALTTGERAFSTGGFPAEALMATAKEGPSLKRIGPTAWALDRFTPRLGGVPTRLTAVAALDVTDVERLVRGHLWKTLGVLAAGATLCLVIGARLAMTMSGALNRLSSALRRLERQEYVKVDVPATGDELEDLATGFNTMIDGLRERDKLRATMGKYMTASVMEHLLTGTLALGGETLEVTILFTDIRGFTSISEGMSAQSLVTLLNEYFTEMVGVVIEHDGAVDKYIGDAIMAVFGAPVPSPRDATNAVRAAVAMRAALARFNERLSARGFPPVRTGIGIHTGEVVAGNIGSDERMEYTVIGDAVNLASRLESNTKDLHVDILISEATYRLVSEAVEARPVREITVKGRNKPVMTYEVVGLRADSPVGTGELPTP